ncbi:hypothetical protein U1Q18_035703 [Sarracenia purpurea var. burkii]
MSFGDLPNELLVDILTRLPAETLVRFTSVCKSWYSLIKNPTFITSHLNRSLSVESNGYLLCMPVDYCQTKLCTILCAKTLFQHAKLELPFRCDFTYCPIVGSVNGLLCLVDAFDGRKLYLCNPVVRKYKAIGYSNSIHECIAANPYVVLGFGYHQKTNDYKVLRIMYVANSDDGVIHREVEVYRLSTGSWRKVGGVFLWTILNQLPAALVKENLHWVVSSPESKLDEVILSFDVGEEVFREIILPDYRVDEIPAYGSLCVLRECLSFFIYCPFKDLEGSEKCYLWVMKEYGVADSWNKQYTVVLEERVERLFGITRFDEVLLKNSEKEVVLYDLENHQAKCFSGISTRPYRFDIVPFVGSLLFLEGGDGILGRESSFEGTSHEGTSTPFKEEEDH